LVLISLCSRPARQQAWGRRANLFEVVEVVTERAGTIALMIFGETRASRKEEDPGGSAKGVLSHGLCCCVWRMGRPGAGADG
jgi:hypothetical protein